MKKHTIITLAYVALTAVAVTSLGACQTAGLGAGKASPAATANPNSPVKAKAIPTPAELAVDIIVSGRVSTLKHIDIVNVGKQIPYTYSQGKISNSPGFEWWVSKHFALKSDRPVDQIQLYLELLEMSYPHYQELFGAAPANINNQRIAAVYGSSKSDTKIFVTDDGLQRGISAGGEAMYYNLAGYSFPSAREQHQRYIVIHEQGHAFQMALMDYPGWLPTWFTEGTADALAHHYYDPIKKQLKVMVFDRGSPMDYIQLGLKEYQQLDQPTIADMTANEQLYRGINFLIVHFMLDDPRRSHLFKAYRDEMARLRQAEDNDGRALSAQILQQIFGDWAQVEKDFSDYVANIEKTFFVAGGPWEQDGNQYWVRVLNNSYELGSPRLDMHLAPQDKPVYKPFKFDQPLAPPATLLTDIQRGTAQPSVGVEVFYQRDHLPRGTVGLALAVVISAQSKTKLATDIDSGAFDQKTYNPDEDSFLAVTVEHGDTLVIDGSRLGQFAGTEAVAGSTASGQSATHLRRDALRRYALPAALVNELKSQSQPHLGIQATIAAEQLVVRVATAQQAFVGYYPLTGETRQQLLAGHLGLLAENAAHRIIPYFADGRQLNPHPVDLTVAAPVNPWRDPADPIISRLTRAIWRLGEHAPSSLVTLNQQMIAATDQGPQAQLAALERFEHAFDSVFEPADSEAVQPLTPSLLAQILTSGASAEVINHALLELSGLSLRLEWQQQVGEQQPVVAVLYNGSNQAVSAQITLSQGSRQQSVSSQVTAGGRQDFVWATTEQSRLSGDKIIAQSRVNWRGQTISLQASSDARPYPWSSMTIVEPAQLVASVESATQTDRVAIVAEFRGPHAGRATGKMRLEGYPSHIFEQAVIELPVDIKPYQIQQFSQQLRLKADYQTPPYAVDVSFTVEIDGEPVLVKQRSLVQGADKADTALSR